MEIVSNEINTETDQSVEIVSNEINTETDQSVEVVSNEINKRQTNLQRLYQMK